jgi:hypothetical protein
VSPSCSGLGDSGQARESQNSHTFAAEHIIEPNKPKSPLTSPEVSQPTELMQAVQQPDGHLVFEGTNIALEANCYQSSFYPPGSYHETNEIANGNRTGSYSFHTDNQDRPWLIIRLDRPKDFDEIVVFNRLDCNAEKARHLAIEVSSEAINWWTAYDGLSADNDIGGIDGNPLRVILPGSKGKYFRFSLPEFGCLHLDSVEIYKY